MHKKYLGLKDYIVKTMENGKKLFLKLGNIDENMLDHKLTVKQVLPNYKAESFQYQILQRWYKIKSRKPETMEKRMEMNMCSSIILL